MTKPIAENDNVQIISREATNADIKSQLYYPHYAGLAGIVAKIYADQTALVNIQQSSLPSLIRTRHEAGTNVMRQKWLDGLSDEARNRLSASEKKFALRYTILISVNDLVGAGSSDTEKLEAVTKSLEAAASKPQEALDLGTEAIEPARITLSDIEAGEQKHLDEIAQRTQDA